METDSCPVCGRRDPKLDAPCVNCKEAFFVWDMVETLDGDHMCRECADECGMT